MCGREVGILPANHPAPSHMRIFRSSFCPDPCCGLYHDRITSHLLKTSPNSLPVCPDSPCHLTAPAGKHHCLVMENFNRDLLGMFRDEWNLTCTCPATTVFDFDSQQCVDVNECWEEPSIPPERKLCKEGMGFLWLAITPSIISDHHCREGGVPEHSRRPPMCVYIRLCPAFGRRHQQSLCALDIRVVARPSSRQVRANKARSGY